MTAILQKVVGRSLLALAARAVPCVALALTNVGMAQRQPGPPPPVVPDIKTPAPVIIKEAITPERQAALDQRAAALNVNPKPQQPGGENLPSFTLTQPQFDEVEGSLWVRGQTYKAQFNAEGVTYIPFMGASAPRLYPVHFSIASISIGGTALEFQSVAPVREANQIIFDRGPVKEIYHIGLESIEQTFVFNQKPAGNGDLDVRISVTTDLTGAETGAALQFSGERGSVHYSKAVVVDALDTHTNVATGLAGGAIHITVPASLVDASAYPIVIDPIISTFTVYAVDQNNRWPDVAYNPGTDDYIIVWENQFGPTDGDVASRRFDFDGTPIDTDPVFIDFTSANWRKPKVAHNAVGNNYLVAAERGAAPNRIIWGRTRVANGATMGAQFQIGDPAAQSGDQFNADVGGDPDPQPSSFYFVIWQRVFSATDHDVHARLVTSAGANSGGIVLIDNSGGTMDVTPRISKSTGHQPFATMHWTIVWARQFTATDFDIHAAQRHWDGTLVNNTYAIDTSGVDNRNPRVSSRLDEDVIGAERRYMVVYEEAPGGIADVYSRVYRGTTLVTETNLTTLEGVETAPARRMPTVESLNNAKFVVAYEQQFSGSDWDAYISQYCLNGMTYRVAEQHRNLGFNITTEGQLNLAGIYKSGGGFPREFTVAWSDTSGGLGTITGARYDAKVSCCIADVNNDGTTNVNDLLMVINQWSGFCLTCNGDANGDKAVNVNDLLIVINGWGPCP